MIFPWLQKNEESLFERVAFLPLDVLAILYGTAARTHRFVYRCGFKKAKQLDCRVVSIGNLIVGGSGKTPMTAWLANALSHRGFRVAIASRGYGRIGREEIAVVSDGEKVLLDPTQFGDEPVLLAQRTPGVPVLVGARRDQVGAYAIREYRTQVLLLDDGFQHHRLERDVEILMLDGMRGFGNHRVLPRGPLREPLSTLRLADAVCVLDGPLAKSDAEILARFAPRAKMMNVQRQPNFVLSLRAGIRMSPSELKHLRIGVLAGLANPNAFRRTLLALGAEIVAEKIFPDHHLYAEGDIVDLAKASPGCVWVTTEKDAIKIRSEWIRDLDLRVLSIDLAVDDAESFLDWLEERLRS